MNWSVSVLSALSSDTEPTIVVNFDSAKYIFNAGENTTRAFLQSHRGWKRTAGLFLTRINTQRTSGTAGFLMSLADGGIKQMHVAGPRGLLHFLASMRLYLYRDTMSVDPVEIPSKLALNPDGCPDPVYKDDNISLYAIPLASDSGRQGMPQIPPNVLDVSNDDLFRPSLKRKRSSPPSSSLPPSVPSNSANLGFLKPVGASTSEAHLVALINATPHGQFHPKSLQGDLAQEWRRMIISAMFPRVAPTTSDNVRVNTGVPEHTSTKRPKRESGSDSNVGRGTQSEVLNDLESFKPPPDAGFAIHKQIHATTPIDVELEAPVQGNLPGWYRPLPSLNSLSGGGVRSDPVLAYVLVGPQVRGKFDVQKANALGLGPGRLRGKVAKGETVRFMVDDKSGNKVERIVKPEDCVGPSEKCGVVILLDVPTTEYITGLASSFDDSPFFSGMSNPANEKYNVHLVVHLCGEGVLADDRYRTFMNRFGTQTHHLVASSSHGPDPVTFTSAAYNQLKLNHLDPEMFPLPRFRLDASSDLPSVSNLPPTTFLLRSNTLIGIRPPKSPIHEKKAVDRDIFHPAVLSSAPLSLPEPLAELFASSRAVVKNHEDEHLNVRGPGDDVTIIPLGTSSAVPTKYRNVSSTLIIIPSWGNILLDTGEGSWGQLVRFFGPESSGVFQMLRDLKCVFISHIHGDHHIGIAKILAMRQRLDPLPSEPLYLVANHRIISYIREYSDIEDLGMSNSSSAQVVTIFSESLDLTSPDNYGKHNNSPQSAVDDLCRALGLRSFSTISVNHRIRCHGVVIKHDCGWSIVYSGDTMPSSSLVEAGKNATLLIHEATMGDDEVDLAEFKAHSTVGQAVDVGEKMNVQNVLLTHFSARYPKMPPFASSQRLPIIALAFDNARIRMGDIWKLNTYLPAIERSFEDSPEGDEQD